MVSGIVQLLHPQPFLYVFGDDGQKDDDSERAAATMSRSKFRKAGCLPVPLPLVTAKDLVYSAAVRFSFIWRALQAL